MISRTSHTIVIMFKLMGELSEAIVWPTINIGNEGGFILTATHLIQHPAERTIPEKNSYKCLFFF
jgi:hypothetical protein